MSELLRARYVAIPTEYAVQISVVLKHLIRQSQLTRQEAWFSALRLIVELLDPQITRVALRDEPQFRVGCLSNGQIPKEEAGHKIADLIDRFMRGAQSPDPEVFTYEECRDISQLLLQINLERLNLFRAILSRASTYVGSYDPSDFEYWQYVLEWADHPDFKEDGPEG